MLLCLGLERKKNESEFADFYCTFLSPNFRFHFIPALSCPCIILPPRFLSFHVFFFPFLHFHFNCVDLFFFEKKEVTIFLSDYSYELPSS